VFNLSQKELKLQRRVKTKEFSIIINILGLRKLRSFGLLPVQKAFVKMLTKNMLPAELAQCVSNLLTEPSRPGSNPNINTSISFTCELPVEKLYVPVLGCEVFDQICKGLKQPKLGTFNIPIGEIMHEQIDERVKLLNEGDKAIKFLEKHA
jgi:hypothetical protein